MGFREFWQGELRVHAGGGQDVLVPRDASVYGIISTRHCVMHRVWSPRDCLVSNCSSVILDEFCILNVR